eukprot:6940513-Pyramimonas_sp.AAC.1
MAREPAPSQQALEVIFLDDGAFAVLGDPLELLQLAPQIAGTVASSFACRGLTLNFKAGKTE